MRAPLPIAKLPLAALLLAAVASYWGLPQIVVLSRARDGGMAVVRLLDHISALSLAHQLASLSPDSLEAQNLQSELDFGAKALASIAATAEFVAATAPALARSSLSYVPPRPETIAPDFASCLAALAPPAVQTMNRPPPLQVLRLDFLQTPLLAHSAAAPVRAPPLSLR